MRNEWPNTVPHPNEVRIPLMWSMAFLLTIGRMVPLTSLHENSGSTALAGSGHRCEDAQSLQRAEITLLNEENRLYIPVFRSLGGW